MAHAKRIALIGFGAIGREIAAVLARSGETAQLSAALVRPGRAAGPYQCVHDIQGLLATQPDVVLECAGHGAVQAYGPALLSAGARLIITSTGALAAEATVAALRAAEAKGRGQLLMAAGAVGGLDGISAARLGGLQSVSYTSYKPPRAWRGTAAELSVNLDAPDKEQTLFEGSAREAALAYPKNANVAIAVALCGLGLDRTRVKLISSRKVSDPVGVIEAEGHCGRFRFESFANAAPDNPKTSLLTAYSLLQCARLGQGLPVLDLMENADAH